MSELPVQLSRLWTDLIARPEGPFGFRLLLQPVVIALLLGFVAYLLIRGPIDRIARRRRGGNHGEADQTQHSRHLG